MRNRFAAVSRILGIHRFIVKKAWEWQDPSCLVKQRKSASSYIVAIIYLQILSIGRVFLCQLDTIGSNVPSDIVFS